MPILSPPTLLQAPPRNSMVPPMLSSFPVSCSRFYAFHFKSNHALSSPINLRRPFPPSLLSPSARPRRHRHRHRLGAARGPPSPPESGPPPKSGSRGLRSVAASLSRFQDSVQIFFAVLFWMSLFFWASAWDRRNRPGKGSRSRR